MRLLSPETYESSNPKATHRSKHHRRIPPSQSSTQEPNHDDHEDRYTPTNSPEDYATNDESQPDAYSDFRSSAPPSSFQASTYSLPTPNYINVAPLPIFHGAPGECPVIHLSRFERVCRANNATALDTVVRIFPVTLDGEAALWYELTVEPHPSMPWDEIKSAFLQAYRPPDFADRARAELMAMRQREGEGVNAYHLRMRWILKKWPDHGMPDKMLKGIFVDGLREDFQDWVVPQQPETLEEAVRLALGWEQAQSARAARRRNGTQPIACGTEEVKCGFCDGPHEEATCEVRKRMRELWLRSREETRAADERGAMVPGVNSLAVVSPVGSMVRREGREGEELHRVVSLGRRSQCQCWKHQCWKKYERSNSGVPEGNPPTE